MSNYRKNHPERIKEQNLKHNFGISMKLYNEMVLDYKGVCGICSKSCSTGKNLAVDHCHKTGKIRGLLCANCNNGLGRFNDNIRYLFKAILFLVLGKFSKYPISKKFK